MHLSGSQGAQSVTSFVFFKIHIWFFLIICVYTPVCGHMHVSAVPLVSRRGCQILWAEVTGLWAVQCGFRKRTPISLPLSHASSPIMLLDYWTLGSLSSAAEEALSHWKLMAQGQSTFSEHIFFSYCNQTYFINLQVQDLSWLISEQTLDCNLIFSWKFYKTFYAKLSNFLTTALPWSWDYCDKCLSVW